MRTTSHRKKTLTTGFLWVVLFNLASAPGADEMTLAYASGEAPLVAPNIDLKEIVPALPPAPVSDGAEHDDLETSSTAAQDTSSDPVRIEEDEDKFIMLGSKVAAGTSTRLAWSADGNESGLSTPTPVMVIRGEKHCKTM